MRFRSKPVEVEAIQFDGTEQSAVQVIAWGAERDPRLEITRHWHKGSWNDRDPQLQLRVGPGGPRVEPGDWAVHDGHENAEVWGHDGFLHEFEPVHP